jgi:uncharacterized protein
VHQTEGQRFLPPSRAQLLADLRWLLLSPPLLCDTLYPGQIQKFSGQERVDIVHWLDQLARREPALTAAHFEMETYQRLGRYAEKLLKFFLVDFSTQSGGLPKAFQLLAHNLALNSKVAGGSTQGEIDFLLQDSLGQHWHWELAVKFFACEPLNARASPETVQASEIIGPNRRDRLSLKIAKLFDRQLRHIIPPPFAAYAWQAQAFAKGRIYYRLGEAPPLFSMHQSRPLLNPEHERGFWCLVNERHLIDAEFPQTTLYPLYRSEWLSPKTVETLDPDRAYLVSNSALEPSRLPLMVAVMRDNIELGRGFILPQDHLLKNITV